MTDLCRKILIFTRGIALISNILVNIPLCAAQLGDGYDSVSATTTGNQCVEDGSCDHCK